MSFNSRLVIGAQSTTGDIDGNAAGTVEAGPTFLMQKAEKGTLSATVTVDAETNTIEMFAEWEVSADSTTWVRTAPVNNAATVKLATGTGGADAAVTRVVPANDACYGWRYARCSIRNEVASGTTSDTYTIKYNYAKPDWI